MNFSQVAQVQGTLRKDYAVAAQNLWDKDPGAWTGANTWAKRWLFGGFHSHGATPIAG